MNYRKESEEIYLSNDIALGVPTKVAICGVALLSLLPKDMDFIKDLLTFSFYDQGWFYSSGTRLTESLCSAYPRIRGQMYGLKLRYIPFPNCPGPDCIESEVLSKNIIYDIGNIILSGSNDLTIN